MPVTKRTASGVLGGLLGLVGLSAVAGVLITATITPAIAVAGNAASGAVEMFDNLPDDLKIDELMLPTKFYYTDASGKPVEMARFYEQNRIPVQYNQIAPVAIDALVSSEDGRFFTHGGIDMVGTVKALIDNVRKQEGRGGSSLSQQYVKNVQIQICEKDAADEEERQTCYLEAVESQGNEGLERKLREMRYAISLEQKYSKETILLGYLNIANFGSVNYGIEAASNYYFGTTAANLNLSQAATLAGMVQNPNRYRIDDPASETNGAANGYAETKERQVSVLWNMHKDGKITDAEYEAAKAAPIEPKITPQTKGCAKAVGMEYFCQMVRDAFLVDENFGATEDERRKLLDRGGLNIYTTLNPNLQANATQAMAEIVPPTWDYDGMKLGGSGVNVEVKSGRILAIAQNTHFTETGAPAGTDPNAYSSQVFASDQHMGGSAPGFSVGSTFKIFTLMQWLIDGHSVNERLNAVYRGENYEYEGNCDGYTAAGNSRNFNENRGYNGNIMRFTRDSLNTGFLAMGAKLKNVCDVGRLAAKFGAVPGRVIDGAPEKLDTNGLYWLLGSANISPLAMAGAYAGVANGGLYCPTHAIDSVTNSKGEAVPYTAPKCEQVVSKEVAATALYALKGVMDGGGTGELGNPYDGTEVAGKTGTHEAVQTWLIETSSAVTSAAWVGNREGFVNMYDAGNNNLRYYLAQRLQQGADRYYPAGPFPAPDDNLMREVRADVPNVTGMSIDDATRRLNEAGFEAAVGAEVPSDQAKGIIVSQDLTGSVVAGSTVTISPSSGKPKPPEASTGRVPDVSGMSVDDATRALAKAGYSNIAPSCTESNGAGNKGRVTSTDPAAGSSTPVNRTITLSYERNRCP